MTKFLLLFLLLPAACAAQSNEEVRPVLSSDYSALIQKAAAGIRSDSAGKIARTGIILRKGFNRNEPVKSIGNSSGQAIIFTDPVKQLTVGINYTTGITFSKANNPVQLQHEYVQGRSQGGKAAWRGPETGEALSYGPAANTLEYDGAAYPYDAGGRLVEKGTGNGIAANVYSNNIFSTGRAFSSDIKAAARLIQTGRSILNFNMRYIRNDERYFMKENSNSSDAFSAGMDTKIKKTDISASYSYLNEGYSNDNSHGFLNRAYQNALLTPVSFSNDAGTLIGISQRSYNPSADNPLFLLQSPGNGFSRHQTNAALTVSNNNYRKVTYSLIQSFERLQELSSEMYRQGAASFPAGLAAVASKHSSSYFLKGNAAYRINHNNWRWQSSIAVNYVLADKHTGIDYTNIGKYAYQRTSHDVSLSFFNEYSYDRVEAGISTGNKLYFSNTAGVSFFFLPYIDAYIQVRPGEKTFTFKLASSLNRSMSEASLNQSYSQAGLMRLNAQDALSYFPNTEVASYKCLSPVDNTEANIKLEISHRRGLTLSTEIFLKNNKGIVFPVFESGNPVLKNIGNTQSKGIEISFLKYQLYPASPKVSVTNRFSFIAYANTVTQVNEGYNYTPIAGFSNVYKAIVKGMSPGVIVGSAYLRDNQNSIVIGADGFPLVSPDLKVIGDPTPDFTVKLSNIVSYKKWTVNVDLEWQKGGDIWNGTQAVLDYYGRSASSGALRNTTDYVFAGNLQDGKPNNIPVSFYDPSLPVQNNRWVRYGVTGVAESYIQKAAHLKLNALSVSYTQKFKKTIRLAMLSAFVNNVILWTAYKGTGTEQNLYGQPNATGLDFFNLPSLKNYGLTLSLQF